MALPALAKPRQACLSATSSPKRLHLPPYQAGIIAETNYGDLYKIKWSRTSRTDKGVHALSSVFSFRALVDEKLCEADPEGISYAAAINEHLPEYVRVFSVQRVSKKYNCRWVQPANGHL
jgi:tRNA pseudouridine38-40 synthase